MIPGKGGVAEACLVTRGCAAEGTGGFFTLIRMVDGHSVRRPKSDLPHILLAYMVLKLFTFFEAAASTFHWRSKNMSGDTLLVVVGPQNAANSLAQAATAGSDPFAGGRDHPTAHSNSTAQPSTTGQIRVVKSYSPATKPQAPTTKPQPQRTLPEIERDVQQQMSTMGASSDQIVAILFVAENEQGEFINLPFAKDTGFLGLAGRDLFRRLVVVAQARDNAQNLWNDLRNAGMRVAHFDGTGDSARSVIHQLLPVDEPAAISDISYRSGSPGIPTRSSSLPYCGSGVLPAHAYEAEALGIRRPVGQAVILLVGHSGHGKSKTINRLLGQDLLHIGKSTLGSTTKVIQRVKIPVYNPETGVNITIAFDDTPGLEDTTFGDRSTHATLMRTYKQQYFPKTYPNIILVVASWDSITPDAHNERHEFTSAAGKSIYNLSFSDLVDPDRVNVVVVVTKSMSSWDEFDDFDTIEEKNAQWTIEAGRRTGLIIDIQRRVFPKLAPWDVVFVENGGGRDMRADHPRLPNGELSHQNLFEVIRTVIETSGPQKNSDLAGMHALDLLAKPESLQLAAEATKEILVRRSSETLIDSQTIPTIPPPSPAAKRTQELAESYLGVTYDPIRGAFGRTCVLDLDPSAIQLKKVRSKQSHEIQREDVQSPSVLAGTTAHYSTSSAYQAAASVKSERYILRHAIGVATVSGSKSNLSPDMKRLIDRLPPWSAETKVKYDEFFANYGTHVATKVALGGVLRIILDSTDEATQAQNSAANRDKVTTVSSSRSTHMRNVLVFRDGGASVAAELTRVVEYFFTHPQSPPEWDGICTEWIKELENDPVFCPDDPRAEYKKLHELGGLTSDQRKNLRQASDSYLAPRHSEPEGMPNNTGVPDSTSPLPREKNNREVRTTLIQRLTHALAKLTGSVGAGNSSESSGSPRTLLRRIFTLH
ncbi:hypothetical protein K438DRAFT_2136538 [Mycena galopus ATCC 62051]|nr:hypothetical protein K438DRAFT_2136538 [Mycena galopus ATCC 62051]